MKANHSFFSILGGSLLIAGCCIGAAMLGLPVLSLSSGFIPTVILFCLTWIYMTITGLLLLEVNLWYKDNTHIVTMAERTLGKVGKGAAWFFFLYLFYSLMVAYVEGAGELFSDFIKEGTGLVVPEWVGGAIISFLFGIMIYLGTEVVDFFNRFLMIGLIGSYLVLLAVGLPKINPHLLTHQNWKFAPFLIPAMVISFGYHNLVASLSTYFHHDKKTLCQTIIIGSLIPLVVYLLWEFVILGIVPPGSHFSEALNSGELASHMLKRSGSSSWIIFVAEYFSYFAIITSFLTVALSFVDFLSDGFQMEEKGWKKFLLCLLTLVPPFIFSLVYPKFFLLALHYAGGFGAVILFGILPALMVWQGRYRQKKGVETRIVPGGKPMLVFVILFSLFTIAIQFVAS